MSADPRRPSPGSADPATVVTGGLYQRFRRVAATDLGRLVTTGVPHLFAALAGMQGMNLVRRILLARILTVEELGIMSYVMAIVHYVPIVASLGISTALLKFAAEPVPHREKQRLYVTSLAVLAASSLLFALLYALVAWLALGEADGDRLIYMLLAAPFIVLSTLATVPLLYMQALKQIKRAARLTVITQFIGLVLVVGATYLFALWGFFTTIWLAPLGNLLILLYVTRRDLHVTLVSWSLVPKLARFGSFTAMANVAGQATPVVVIVLLRYLTQSDHIVGLYAVAVLVLNAARLLPSALTQVAFPYLAGLVHDVQRLRARVRELAIKQLVVLAGFELVWLVLGYYLIWGLLGAKYTDAFWPSVTLMLSMLPFAVTAPASATMIILNRVELNALASITLLGAAAVLCPVLIPSWGIHGATWAVAIAQTSASLLALLLTRSALRRAAREATIEQGGTAPGATHTKSE